MKWPLYAYFLSFFFCLPWDAFLAVYVFQFLGGALNCILIYLIASKIFNKTVAFISALFCLSYGLFIMYEGLLIYTSLSLLLNSCLLLAVLAVKDQPTPKRLFQIGLFLGICTITQANIILFGIVAVILIVFKNKITWRKAILKFFCFSLGLAIVIGSVTLANYLAEKDFALVTGNLGINFYLGNNPKASGTFSAPSDITLNQEDLVRDSKIIAEHEMGRSLKSSQVSRFWFKKAAVFISQNPYGFLKLIFKKILFILRPSDLLPEHEYGIIAEKISIFKIMFLDLRFIMPLALLGMLFGARGNDKSLFLYLIIITLASSMLVFFVIAKLRILIVPFLSIFAALGIYRMLEYFRNRLYRKLAVSVIILISLFILLNFIGYKTKVAADIEPLFEHHLLKAFNYEYNRDFNRAISELKIAQAIQPNNPRALFRLGVAYFKLGNLEAAEENFKQVIAFNQLSVGAYYNLGLIYNMQKRFQEAKDQLLKTVSLDADSSASHFELGVAYKGTGEFKKAKQEFILSLSKLARWRKQERAKIVEELNSLR
jgi:4-amino-4-deoxy-L-arabinose transferase-like glycosyltransferase